MGRIVRTPRRLGHVSVLFFLALSACSNPKGDFTNGRILETCDQSWPACNVIAGCLMGPEDYTQGQFPGDNRVVIQLQQPSDVKVSLFVDQVGSVGTFATFRWYEGGCVQQSNVTMTGQEMVTEAEQQGAVVRDNDLYDVGDHLIEFSSDAQVEYLFKVDITELRSTPP